MPMLKTYLDIELSWAARNGHLDIAKYLVSKGADVRECDDIALRWASENGHLDVDKYLVDNGADIVG